ncbi:TPA: hypothetical protein N0F65_004279 [Lagenidium giganteum]|uniref:Major facilitator superfamily (MFS) profile domain-containing protein n=1 Tax=Lagenidium giganteum TaxID=4803 RepID=A0AAV2ZCZ2_9STRA|nr:TPA: hypothetical protein N0F65_004279 [Lagenidium giganteum]
MARQPSRGPTPRHAGGSRTAHHAGGDRAAVLAVSSESAPLAATIDEGVDSSEATPFLRDPSDRPSRLKRIMGLSKQGVIILLCTINLFNYIDRGIIPGAPIPFQNFIKETLNTDKQGVYFGVLASAFIATYSIFSLLFGYLSITYRPFRMLSFGMSVWVIAVIICGVAQHANSYYLLLFGRVLSGVGEASFQCNAAPFIDMHAPKQSRGLWLGVFLASITVGTAVGYIYGSSFGKNWAFAFYGEAAAMVILVLCCLFLVPDELDQVPRAPHDDDLKHKSVTSESELHDALLEFKEDPQRAGFLSEIWFIFRNLTFTLVVLGHSAYTFSLAALSVFSPVLFIGLGMFEKETQVAMAFGGIIAVTSTIGTPLGGVLLDRFTKGKYSSSSGRSYVAVALIFILMAVGFVFSLIMMGFTQNKAIFLAVLAICFFCFSALSPAETVAVMEIFPASRRSMAVAVNSMIIHVLGDVPSPIILGALKDSWAPHCNSIVNDKGEDVINPECPMDRAGLKNVLLFPILWLAWGVFFWGVSAFLLRRNFRRSAANSSPQA